MMLLSLISTIHTNQSNRQLAEEQRNWSEQMQDKENEYNLPENQMNRLREAGISPMALQMGKGFDVSGNTSASVNPYQVPQMLDPMSIASNSLLSMMSADKARAEAKTEDDAREVRIANIREQTNKYKEEVVMLGLDAVSQQIANDYAGILNEVAVAKNLSDIGLNEANISYLDSLTDTNLYKLKEVLPQELQLLVDKHELNILDQQEVVARIQNINADTTLKKEETLTEIEKQHNLKTESDLLASEDEDVRNRIKLFLETYDDVSAQIANESKLSKRQVQGFWVNTILHGAMSTGAAAGGAGTLIKAIKAVPK